MTTQTGLPQRAQHLKFEQCLPAYGIPARFRGTSLYRTEHLTEGVARWLNLWSQGDITSQDSITAGLGVIAAGNPEDTSAFAAALTQDALRLGARLAFRPSTALLWVPSISAMHESLRKPDEDTGFRVTMERLKKVTLLVLPDLDPQQGYACETVERVIRLRTSVALPTIVTVTPPDSGHLRGSLRAYLKETSILAKVGRV